jgi:hypothetical protein
MLLPVLHDGIGDRQGDAIHEREGLSVQSAWNSRIAPTSTKSVNLTLRR